MIFHKERHTLSSKYFLEYSIIFYTISQQFQVFKRLKFIWISHSSNNELYNNYLKLFSIQNFQQYGRLVKPKFHRRIQCFVVMDRKWKSLFLWRVTALTNKLWAGEQLGFVKNHVQIFLLKRCWIDVQSQIYGPGPGVDRPSIMVSDDVRDSGKSKICFCITDRTFIFLISRKKKIELQNALPIWPSCP